MRKIVFVVAAAMLLPSLAAAEYELENADPSFQWIWVVDQDGERIQVCRHQGEIDSPPV